MSLSFKKVTGVWGRAPILSIMFFYITPTCPIDKDDIIGIFDMDSATVSFDTRKFLRQTEKRGALISAARDIPKSFVLTDRAVYLAQSAPSSLRNHAEQ